MITRILIRIKVVQMLYSYFLTEKEQSVADALKELEKSLNKAYELYNSLLVLMIDLTDVQDLRLDQAKHKYLPTHEDLNPNPRFVMNQLVQKLRESKVLEDYRKDTPISWRQDPIFIRLMLDKILNSDLYENYMNSEQCDFKADCDFWKEVMKQIILKDEDFVENLESQSVYWNDDLSVMGTFVLKTIKKFEDGKDDKEAIQEMYKDEEDSQFGEKLFNRAVRERDDNNKLIDMFVKSDSWDVERIAFMDRIIMGLALSEIKDFDKIPLKVSMNEYIEIAKYYSTPKSGTYINGILNSAINYLKKEGRITKE